MIAYWGGRFWVMNNGQGNYLSWSDDGLTWSLANRAMFFSTGSHFRMAFYVAANGRLIGVNYWGDCNGCAGVHQVREIYGPNSFGPIYNIKTNYLGPGPGRRPALLHGLPGFRFQRRLRWVAQRPAVPPAVAGRGQGQASTPSTISVASPIAGPSTGIAVRTTGSWACGRTTTWSSAPAARGTPARCPAPRCRVRFDGIPAQKFGASRPRTASMPWSGARTIATPQETAGRWR